jgi:hypothetical protein
MVELMLKALPVMPEFTAESYRIALDKFLVSGNCCAYLFQPLLCESALPTC